MKFDMALARDSRSPREARRRLNEELTRCRFPDQAIEDAVLLVSELVTNAIMHGEGDVHLSCVIDGKVARVGVSDGDGHHPLVRDRDIQAIGGRGMQLVEMLAARWWVETEATGKTVWFEIDH